MILRRSKPEPPPPPRPEWRRRFDEAASMIRSNSTATWVDSRLAALETALVEAHDDIGRLDRSIEQLDAPTAQRQLKDALREQQLGGLTGSEQVEARVRTLRHRYDTVNGLMNRREALQAQIAHALSDVEVLSINVLSAGAGAGDAVAEQLERLNDDLSALAAAHEELRGL